MCALKFDWEEVSHKAVSAVVGRSERRMNGGSLAWDELALVVGTRAVVLTVTANTDEIVVAHEPRPDGGDWKPVTALSDAVGKSLGWCWVGTNYLGYCDSFTLALGDVVPDALQPRLTFVAEGAALTCFDLKPRTA
jgi:hypothetical protein